MNHLKFHYPDRSINFFWNLQCKKYFISSVSNKHAGPLVNAMLLSKIMFHFSNTHRITIIHNLCEIQWAFPAFTTWGSSQCHCSIPKPVSLCNILPKCQWIKSVADCCFLFFRKSRHLTSWLTIRIEFKFSCGSSRSFWWSTRCRSSFSSHWRIFD